MKKAQTPAEQLKELRARAKKVEARRAVLKPKIQALQRLDADWGWVSIQLQREIFRLERELK